MIYEYGSLLGVRVRVFLFTHCVIDVGKEKSRTKIGSKIFQ